MGDGVSDLGARGELSPEGMEDYVLDLVRFSPDRVWKTHTRSTRALNCRGAINRLVERGALLREFDEDDDGRWMRLSAPPDWSTT